MIYVMSDIHGNARRFQSVMDQIHLRPEDTLYVLGDVIDRHPDGIRILRKLMAMPNVKMILGNHEYMMLDVMDRNDDPRYFTERYSYDTCLLRWYQNGGLVTHSYLKHIRKTVRAEIFAYLRNLPLNLDVAVNGKTYRLIHGGPAERYQEYRDKYVDVTHFAVWKRWETSDPDSDGCTLIFGHTPTSHYQPDSPLRIWYGKNIRRIGIDCGSGYPDPPEDERIGRLACLRLEDMKEFYSEI